MGHPKKVNGFTLIELVFVICLVGITAVVGTKLFAQGFQGLLNQQNFLDADWQGQITLERMTRDIHSIRTASNISTATANQLIFTNGSGTTESYVLTGAQLTLNGEVLADGISSFSLSYYNRNGTLLSPVVIANICYIQIALTITQNNVSHTFETTIFPWNFT